MSAPSAAGRRPRAERRRRAMAAAALTAAALLGLGGSAGPVSHPFQTAPPSGRPCALPAHPGTALSEGFPAGPDDEFAPSTGTVEALTLLIDFPDVPAASSARDRYAEFFPSVSDWFARASYGRLVYRSTPVLRYLRMPRPFTDYGIERGYDWDVHTAMMRDLVAVVDADVDFSGYDLVNVLVTPEAGPPAQESVLSVTWTGASAAVTDDGAGIDRVSLLYGHDQSGYRVLSHENGHIFGLPDLYAADEFRRTDELAGQWDSMSLDWGLQGELLAWHKWRLGWLDDHQVGCAAGPGVRTYLLGPVSVPGGRKAVVVPYGRTAAYVVEVRAARGNDAEACSEGVLVYRIRTDVDSGDGPVTVMDARPGTTACEYSSSAFNSLNDAPYRVGQRFGAPDADIAVDIVERHPDGRWTVRVTRR